MSAAAIKPQAKPFDGKDARQRASRDAHIRSRAASRVRSCRVLFSIKVRKGRIAMPHPETGHQSIECSVVSCKYHDREGKCSLERIQVEPTPMAYTGEAADESMCGSYKNR